MRVFGTAAIAIGVGSGLGAMSATTAAQAARFVVEYSCRDSATLVRLVSARERAHPRIFQAKVHKAVVTGRCKIVRYSSPRPSKTARKRVKPAQVAAPVKPQARVVAAATVRETSRIYVPARSATIRVSEAASAQRANGYSYFPNPQTFMPVR